VYPYNPLPLHGCLSLSHSTPQAGQGCKGIDMWVPKGAKYLPDPPRPAKEIQAEEDAGVAAEPGALVFPP